MAKKNKRVLARIFEGVRMMNYPQGTPIIAEVLYKDLQNLEKEGHLDFSDVVVNDSDETLEATMISNCHFALVEMAELKHVTKEAIDLAVFPTVSKRHRVQFRFNHDSCTALDKITMKSLQLHSMLNQIK